jgi:hypothetical protein
MRESTFKINQNEWENSIVSSKRFSEPGNDNSGMIKARLGFIYFVVLVSSIIVLLTR